MNFVRPPVFQYVRLSTCINAAPTGWISAIFYTEGLSDNCQARKTTNNISINVALKRVRVTIVAVQKKEYCLF